MAAKRKAYGFAIVMNKGCAPSIFNDQFITEKGSGLKRVATSMGFARAVDDPGGGESMLYYDTAVGATELAARERAREWLLTYNQGDVEPTLPLRSFLEANGSIPIDRVAGLASSRGRCSQARHIISG